MAWNISSICNSWPDRWFMSLTWIDLEKPSYITSWVFPNIGVSQNGRFIMENPIKMDDLGGKPTIFGNIQLVATQTCLTVYPHLEKMNPFWLICFLNGLKPPSRSEFAIWICVSSYPIEPFHPFPRMALRVPTKTSSGYLKIVRNLLITYFWSPADLITW